MLNSKDYAELNGFLNRLQSKNVSVEVSSRLNMGFVMSFTLKVEKQGEKFRFVSKDSSILFEINPNEAENFKGDFDSVSLIYGDNIVCIRYARTR